MFPRHTRSNTHPSSGSLNDFQGTFTALRIGEGQDKDQQATYFSSNTWTSDIEPSGTAKPTPTAASYTWSSEILTNRNGRPLPSGVPNSDADGSAKETARLDKAQADSAQVSQASGYLLDGVREKALSTTEQTTKFAVARANGPSDLDNPEEPATTTRIHNPSDHQAASRLLHHFFARETRGSTNKTAQPAMAKTAISSTDPQAPKGARSGQHHEPLINQKMEDPPSGRVRKWDKRYKKWQVSTAPFVTSAGLRLHMFH